MICRPRARTCWVGSMQRPISRPTRRRASTIMKLRIDGHEHDITPAQCRNRLVLSSLYSEPLHWETCVDLARRVGDGAWRPIVARQRHLVDRWPRKADRCAGRTAAVSPAARTERMAAPASGIRASFSSPARSRATSSSTYWKPSGRSKLPLPRHPTDFRVLTRRPSKWIASFVTAC